MTDNRNKPTDILLPLWGTSAVGVFLDTALPALLADGNLPALARATDVTFVLLTGEADRRRIEAHPQYARLQAVCKIELVPIDDLIALSAYGITISLSFARGIGRRGAQATERSFLLLMGDFIFADGALKAIHDKAESGAAAVFAPTYRVSAEFVSTRIRDLFASSGGSLQARRLAALTIDHLHSISLAKFIDNDFCHATHTNQFHWMRGPDTVISHQFLMHLFLVRPERAIGTADYFFDYGLFLDVCPSARYAVVEDSDDCMVLESQSTRSELSQVRWGACDIDSIVDDLAEWTTPVHRLLAPHAVVLHKHDLELPLAELDREPRAFIEGLLRRLPPPVAAAEHPYWKGSMGAWIKQRRMRRLDSDLTEFGLAVGRYRTDENLSLLVRILLALKQAATGEPPKVTLLHPLWAEFRALRAAIGKIDARADRPAVVVTMEPTLIPLFAAGTSEFMSRDQLQLIARGSRMDVFLDVDWGEGDNLSAYLEAGYAALADGGRLLLCVRGSAANVYPRPEQSARVLAALHKSPGDCIELRVISGTLRRANLALVLSSVRDVTAKSRGERIRGLFKLGLLIMLSFATNLAQLIASRSSAVVGTETMLLCRITRRPRSGGSGAP